MNERGESDRPVVPEESPKADYWEFHRQFVEGMEGRGLAKENEQDAQDVLLPAGPAKRVDRTQSGVGAGTASPEDLHSALDRVRQAACRDKQSKFTSLRHHVYNVDRLREAYLALKRDASAGVDGQTWQAYGQELESNLNDLSVRLVQGRYRAKPVKRVYIPKADGRERPIGVPVLEDKIVQRATVAVLNAVYETDFLGHRAGTSSPGRSAHRALDALAVGLGSRKVNYVLDADIRGFFDTLDHGWLMKFVGHRIGVPNRRVPRLGSPRGPARAASHPEMAERGRAGRRQARGAGRRDAAGREHRSSSNSAKRLTIEAVLPRARLRPVYGQGCLPGPGVASIPPLSADRSRGGDGHGRPHDAPAGVLC